MPDAIELGEFDIDSFLQEIDDADSACTDRYESRQIQVVFAIDASNSMQGHKIGAINDCVNNAVSKLRSLDRGKNGAISVSAIGFSGRLFKWTEGFVPAASFKYSYVEMVDGLTNANALFQELASLAETHMVDESDKYVVLFSDGLITEDYRDSLEQWRRVGRYGDIRKIVMAFDDDLSDCQSLDFFHEFADSGMVISMNEQEKLLSELLG
jgi:uncharacterized protein YegL